YAWRAERADRLELLLHLAALGGRGGERVGVRAHHDVNGNRHVAEHVAHEVGLGREAADGEIGAELDAIGEAAAGGDRGFDRLDALLEQRHSGFFTSGTIFSSFTEMSAGLLSTN